MNLLVHFVLLRSEDHIVSSFIIRRKYNLVIVISKINITNPCYYFTNNVTNFFELSIIRFKIRSPAFIISILVLS